MEAIESWIRFPIEMPSLHHLIILLLKDYPSYCSKPRPLTWSEYLSRAPALFFLKRLLGLEFRSCCTSLPAWSHPFQKDNTRFWEASRCSSVSLRTSSKLSSEEEEEDVDSGEGISMSSVNLDLRGCMLASLSRIRGFEDIIWRFLFARE